MLYFSHYILYKIKEKRQIKKKKLKYYITNIAYKKFVLKCIKMNKYIKKYNHRYENRLLFSYTHSDILPMAHFTRILNALIKIVAYTYSGACNDRV